MLVAALAAGMMIAGMTTAERATAAEAAPKTKASPQEATASKSAAKKPSPAKTDVDFFERKIRPVLIAHCYECHSEKSKIVQASLYLDTREGMRRGGDSGPAVVPGKSEESLLIEAMRFQSLEMPPAGKLADDVIADFVKWVESGAADPRDGKAPVPQTVDLAAGRQFWSYQPPRASPAPQVIDGAWPRTEADRFVLAKLEAEGLRPAADAEPAALIRRVYFDLIGLPPPPEEVEAFVKHFSPSLRLSFARTGRRD